MGRLSLLIEDEVGTDEFTGSSSRSFSSHQTTQAHGTTSEGALPIVSPSRTIALIHVFHSLLKTTSTPFATLTPFVAPFAVPPLPPSSDTSSDATASSDAELDSDRKPSLPAFLAIEFLADACADEAAAGHVKEKGVEAAAVSPPCVRTRGVLFQAELVFPTAVLESRPVRPDPDKILALPRRTGDQVMKMSGQCFGRVLCMQP